jgi:hypothetical protein
MCVANNTSLHFTYMARVNRAPTEGANRLMDKIILDVKRV